MATNDKAAGGHGAMQGNRGGPAGAGGPWPGNGPAPPDIANAPSAGVAGTTSRSDHTHRGVTSVNGAFGAITAVNTVTGAGVNNADPANPVISSTGTTSVNGAAGAATLAVGEDLTLNGAAPTLTFGQTLAATWTLPVSAAAPNMRWYALDTTNGNDANAGFSDVSAAAAGLVAVKTAAQLNKILPVDGKGRAVTVLIAAGTYAELTSFVMGRKGYYYFLVRGTVTNATAGSTAFADDTNDRNMNGNVTATGMNAAGYNPTGAPTTQVIQCLTVAAGAPGFPAEVPISLPGGARLRFDINTTTAALRGIRRTVVKITGTDTLTVDRTLPAVPVASDVFYLEMPGAVFLNIGATNDGSPSTGSGITYQLSGLQANGAVAGAQRISVIGAWQLAQCWYTGANSSQLSGPIINVNSGWLTVAGAFQDTGGSCRSNGNFLLQAVGSLQQTLGGVGPYAGSVSITRSGRAELENTFVAVAGVIYSLCSGTAMDSNNADPDCIGTNPTRIAAGAFASRILGGGVTSGLLIEADATICALDITGMGAKPAVKLRATGVAMTIVGALTGSTGNNDVGLDLTNAQGCTIYLPSLPTVTGTNGDVRLSSGTIITWAQAQAGIIDPNGNMLYGGSNAPTRPKSVAAGAVVVTISNAPAGSSATPARYFTIPDGAGGVYTVPSLT